MTRKCGWHDKISNVEILKEIPTIITDKIERKKKTNTIFHLFLFLSAYVFRLKELPFDQRRTRDVYDFVVQDFDVRDIVVALRWCSLNCQTDKCQKYNGKTSTVHVYMSFGAIF